MAKALLTPEEVAERLSVSTQAVREWLRKGNLKGIKVGRLWRIRESDLEYFYGTGKPGQDKAISESDPIADLIGYFGSKPLEARETDKELYDEDSK